MNSKKGENSSGRNVHTFRCTDGYKSKCRFGATKGPTSHISLWPS